MKRITGTESEKRWKVLLERKMPPAPRTMLTPSASSDPYDCSDLVVPLARVMVDRVLDGFIQKWKHLDERRVVDASNTRVQKTKNDGSDNQKRKLPDDDGDDVHPPRRTWGWDARKLRLPENFDYATRKPLPPEDTGHGDRVVSLQDPSTTLSYERELWKIFKSVPTYEQLEEQLAHRTKCTHTRQVHADILQTAQQSPRLDNFRLSRMRMRDRHGLPPEPTNSSNNGTNGYVTTIRLECWRRQLKRGSSPDSHRMEIEFLGSQTLKDAHDAIVELARDDLWRDAARKYRMASESANNEDGDEVIGAATDGPDASGPSLDDSGVFLIEDKFYKTGSIDYVDPIVKWLDGGDETDGPPTRRARLGIADKDSMSVEDMDNVRLDQVVWKLGVRYYHCHHGDVECAVFLTDIRYGPRSTMAPYPILHDIWTPSYPYADCDACRRRPAQYASAASNEKTDGGPRGLCESCCHELELPTNDPRILQKYPVWREQADLSVGHDVPRALF